MDAALQVWSHQSVAIEAFLVALDVSGQMTDYQGSHFPKLSQQPDP